MNLRTLVTTACLLACAVLPARAQWITQTFALKSGWNAVYLHVDATYATFDELFGPAAPVILPIDEVWRWQPALSDSQFVSSPQNPTASNTQWASWKVSASGTSELNRFSANSAYLVHCTADTTLSVKGHPVLPSYKWSTSGLNFFGFPTVATSPPPFDTFFNPVPAIQQGEIYRYPGGPLGAGNPLRVFALRTTPVKRGEAYWIRAGEIYNRYYGPFEISSAGAGAAYGASLSSVSFRVRNLTASPLTVSLTLRASETPPTGEAAIAGVPPLIVRGSINPSTLTYPYTRLTVNTPKTVNLAPAGELGAEGEIVLGLDRSTMGGTPGDQFAGVLQFTDSLGQIRTDMAVSATTASAAGLWVGTAAVTGVGQYLVNYQKDTANNLVLDSSGKYVVSSIITNLTPVPTAFPLRLIVHNPASGPATLFQRIFYGFDAGTNSVVANREETLAPGLLDKARRISATHLPFTSDNTGWAFDGPLGLGRTVTTRVTNAYNDHASNPFLHTYHPDHDNLDATFKNELPQGSESFSITREITLVVKPPSDDFSSLVSSGLDLNGTYVETIRLQGLARAGNTYDTRRFDVRGVFNLNRVSEIPTVSQFP
jgi:hypothetical protein